MKNSEIDSLIEQYNTVKVQADAYASQAKSINMSIKSYLLANDLIEYTTDSGLTIKLSEQNTDKLNETALITALYSLRNNGKLDNRDFSAIVKTKEYIDDDGIENAVYTGVIDGDFVKSFIDKKEPIYKLTIKRSKK